MSRNQAKNASSKQLVTRSKMQRNQPKKHKKQQRVALIPNRNVSAYQLSACAQRYFEVLLNPFDTAAEELPCIPDLIDIPSYKFYTRQRGSITIGTTGYGFVGVSPYAYGNDQVNILSSSSTYGFSGFPVTAARSAAVLESSNSMFPWTAATCPSVRVVGCGLRIRYTGTELNRGGTIIPVLSNMVGDNLSGEGVSENLARPTVRTLQNNRQWAGCVLKPLSPSDYSYTQDLSGTRNLISGANLAGTNIRMGVALTGAVGNTYEYELVIYYECIPAVSATGTVNSVPGTSKSHSDVSALSMIRDYVGGLFDSDMGKAVIEAGKSFFKSSFASTVAATVPKLLLL